GFPRAILIKTIRHALAATDKPAMMLTEGQSLVVRLAFEAGNFLKSNAEVFGPSAIGKGLGHRVDEKPGICFSNDWVDGKTKWLVGHDETYLCDSYTP